MQRGETRDAAKAFESGHVCRVCESHLLKMPGGEYHWCPTCGAETFGAVHEICCCGSKVGRHDAQLRCAPVSGWQDEQNPMVRRKVRVGIKDSPTPAIRRPTDAGAPTLYNDED
jgi:hypothetical protein